MKAILLFPFRLVRALLYPWYIRWVFALPWWILGVFAILLGSYMAQAVPEALATNAAAKIAQIDGPPPLRALHEFDPRRDVTAQGEVNIVATYDSSSGVITLDLMGPDMVAVPLFAKGRPEVAAIAYALTSQEASLLTYLSSQGVGMRHSVQVNGSLRQDGVFFEAARAALAQNGLRSSQALVTMRPYLDGRQAGLASKMLGQWIWLGAGGLLLAVLIIATVRNYGRRGGTRRQSIRMAAPATKARTSKPPTAKALPSKSSPWGGSVQPQPSAATPPALPTANPVPAAKPDPVPVAKPRIASSGYRARTAEEIVREVFGPKSGR